MLGFICFFIEEVYVGTPFLKKAPKTVKIFFLTICNIFKRINTNGFASVEADFADLPFHRPCLFVSCSKTTIFELADLFSKAAEHRRTPGRIRVTAGTPQKARNSRVASRVPDYFVTLLTFNPFVYGVGRGNGVGRGLGVGGGLVRVWGPVARRCRRS